MATSVQTAACLSAGPHCPHLLQGELEGMRHKCWPFLQVLALTWFREIPVVWVCPNRYTLTLSLSLDWLHFTLQLPEPPALEPGRPAPRGTRAALYLSLPFLSSRLPSTHSVQPEAAWLMCASKISQPLLAPNRGGVRAQTVKHTVLCHLKLLNSLSYGPMWASCPTVGVIAIHMQRRHCL